MVTLFLGHQASLMYIHTPPPLFFPVTSQSLSQRNGEPKPSMATLPSEMSQNQISAKHSTHASLNSLLKTKTKTVEKKGSCCPTRLSTSIYSLVLCVRWEIPKSFLRAFFFSRTPVSFLFTRGTSWTHARTGGWRRPRICRA